MTDKEIFDVIIVGGGAAGLTAGIYSSRARLSTLILNEGAIGGQLVLTEEVANYPGVETTKGYLLANTMKNQAKLFGCKIKSNLKILSYQLEDEIKRVLLEDGREFSSRTVILSPGGRPRPLDLPGEEDFKGKGISYCATCDGDFFTGKEVIVVGGGNSALEEAVALTQYARKVTIVHQFDHFQAFQHAIDQAKGNPKIDGVFIFVGYIPNTEDLDGLVKLSERQEIVVDEAMQTSLPGVFAAGDSNAKKYRQVTTAVADGTIASLAAAEFLRS